VVFLGRKTTKEPVASVYTNCDAAPAPNWYEARAYQASREVEPHGANEFTFVVTGTKTMDFAVRFVAEHSHFASSHTVQFCPHLSPADWQILISLAATGCCYRASDFRLCRQLRAIPLLARSGDA
jgi:hypothetical protein